jgi:hypothetical protein
MTKTSCWRMNGTWKFFAKLVLHVQREHGNGGLTRQDILDSRTRSLAKSSYDMKTKIDVIFSSIRFTFIKYFAKRVESKPGRMGLSVGWAKKRMGLGEGMEWVGLRKGVGWAKKRHGLG